MASMSIYQSVYPLRVQQSRVSVSCVSRGFGLGESFSAAGPYASKDAGFSGPKLDNRMRLNN